MVMIAGCGRAGTSGCVGQAAGRTARYYTADAEDNTFVTIDSARCDHQLTTSTSLNAITRDLTIWPTAQPYPR
ncbi:hypothetical protein [Actinocorallia libanotica]|uniref:Uncharacterized protein n=1 Tax=Actinocorallia libanotica TaxID=46162 RepID=A0ABN1RG44_9ACTN